MTDSRTLQLPARQQRMLQAMGIAVWQPIAAPTTPQPQPLVPGAATTRHTPASQQPAPASKPPAVATAGGPSPGSRAADIAQMDWPTLAQAVPDCKACGLCAQRRHSVFGTGSPGADAHTPPRVDWLIVGEAPGEQEDLAGEPFVGQAGKLLDNMLSAVGLSRKSGAGGGVYIINTLKCRPPANRNPAPEELLQCAPFLQRQIELLQPRVILAMGRFAAQSLLQHQWPDVDKVPLGKLRGQAHTYNQIPVVVTYHPAYLLRNLPEKAKAWEDLVRARALVAA